MSHGHAGPGRADVLPESVPVDMPRLPPWQRVTTEQQFKALGDPLRGRILQMVHYRPATAKQIATELGSTPGAIGHHLQVLERAGLVQVIAKRLINNLTVAKYYTRTAAVFVLDFPPAMTGDTPMELIVLDQARDELTATLPVVSKEESLLDAWFPHKQLARERMRTYHQRIEQLVDDFLREAPDPEGEVFSLFITTFRSPRYAQPPRPSSPVDSVPDA